MSDDEIPENALINDEVLNDFIDHSPHVIDDGAVGEDADDFGWLHIPDPSTDRETLDDLMHRSSPNAPLAVSALCGTVTGTVGKYLSPEGGYHLDEDFCRECAALHEVQKILNGAG